MIVIITIVTTTIFVIMKIAVLIITLPTTIMIATLNTGVLIPISIVFNTTILEVSQESHVYHELGGTRFS